MLRTLYEENSANYPRMKTDTYFTDYANEYKYYGFIDNAIKFPENFQLLDSTLWNRFVEQFRSHADRDNGWRGEYWGKMMRGACFTYAYTKNEKLYALLTETVCDILKCTDIYGRISSYSVEREFNGWDLWGRKYVLLGLQYFIEICNDRELKKNIIENMCNQVDYIISKIGYKSEGKKPINSTTHAWRGLNSSSLLEPIVRIYNITKKQEYYDFAQYIVDEGGTEVQNVFDLAYENKMYPYQYPLTKAYELMSCFEGLLEFYRINGNERYKKAVINFADKILESDFTIIGSSGCHHELFDHSTVRQANTTNHVTSQETCVTVTLMKFMWQLTLLTGNSKYADAFEISLYNAYFGALNTERKIEYATAEELTNCIFEPMPFDSYSPLTAGMRGRRAGGLLVMEDRHYYGCCACIGAAGSGLISKMAFLTSNDGLVMNLFINGTTKTLTPRGQNVEFITETEYPVHGDIKTIIKIEKSEKFVLRIRNPYWSRQTQIKVNGNDYAVNDGYISISREWSNDDVVEILLDMRTKSIKPISYAPQIIMTKFSWEHNYALPVYDEEDPIAKKHIAFRRGPIILAQENRLGYSVDEPICPIVDSEGYADVSFPEKEIAPYENIVELCIALEDGKSIHVTDYASAGKLWNEESKMAAWMLTK